MNEASRRFSDVIGRVRCRGERFLLTKCGRVVAELRPSASHGVTGRELARRLGTLPHLGSEAAGSFAADVDAAREAAGKLGPAPWE